MMSFFRNLTIRMRLILLTALLCIFTALASGGLAGWSLQARNWT